jgi:Tripartite tricarboxylate transporter TctB family
MTDAHRPAPRFVRSIYPPLVVMALAVVLFVWTLRYNATAREVPMLVTIGLFVLGAFDLICRFEQQSIAGLRDFWGADFRSPEMKHDPRFADEFVQVAWMVGCVAGMMLVGILPTVPIYIFLYMTISGKRRWLESLIVSAVIFVFVYGVFEILLNYRLYRGVFFDPRGF